MIIGVIKGAIYFGEKDIVLSNLVSILPLTPRKFDYLKSKKDLLVYQPQTTPGVKQNAKNIKVLVYHGIVEKADGENVVWDDFRNEMFALKEAGYETVSLDDLLSYLKGQKTLPEKSFLLTFDDGRKDSYYPVDPVLKVLNYKAVMFIISSTINEKSDFHLSERELKEMNASGRWMLEAHAKNGHKFVEIAKDKSQGHFYSNKMWIDSINGLETDAEYEQRIDNDLTGVQSDLKKLFNVDAIAYAIPYGDYGQQSSNYNKATKELLGDAGKHFKLVFYQTWDESNTQNYPLLDAFMVKRVEVKPSWKKDDLLNVMAK